MRSSKVTVYWMLVCSLLSLPLQTWCGGRGGHKVKKSVPHLIFHKLMSYDWACLSQKRLTHTTQGRWNSLVIAEIPSINSTKRLFSTKARPFLCLIKLNLLCQFKALKNWTLNCPLLYTHRKLYIPFGLELWAHRAG